MPLTPTLQKHPTPTPWGIGSEPDRHGKNLRICTHSGNASNSKLRTDNVTGFRGVVRRGENFRALIKVEGKQRFLGSRKSAEDAARLYDEAALEVFGEFAALNFVPKEPEEL